MIGARPPQDITTTIGMAGPWREMTLTVSRYNLDGQPVVTVDRVCEARSKVNLRAHMDDYARQAGWVLYEDAPLWLRAMFDAVARTT